MYGRPSKRIHCCASFYLAYWQGTKQTAGRLATDGLLEPAIEDHLCLSVLHGFDRAICKAS